jgi:hypothetical protein
MDQASRDTVWRVLSIFCDVVSTLANRLEDRGGDVMIVARLLGSLERYATEIGTQDEATANLMLVVVHSLTAYVYDSKGDYKEVLNHSLAGMKVALPSSPNFYNSADWAARAHFELGQIREGYEILATAIRTAHEQGVDQVEVPSILRTASFSDLNQAVATEEFTRALSDYATRWRGV